MNKRMPSKKTKELFLPLLNLRDFLQSTKAINLLLDLNLSNNILYEEHKNSCLKCFGRKRLSVNRIMFSGESIMTYVKEIDLKLFFDLIELHNDKLTELRKNQIITETVEKDLSSAGITYSNAILNERVEAYKEIHNALKIKGDHKISYLNSLTKIIKKGNCNIFTLPGSGEAFLIRIEKHFISQEIDLFAKNTVKSKLNRL